MSATKLVIATSTILAVAAIFASGDESRAAADETSASISALGADLVNPAGFAIDEVRMADAGFACIAYHMGNASDGITRGHAVVRADRVLKSSSDFEQFDKVWNRHCLGPPGGMIVER